MYNLSTKFFEAEVLCDIVLIKPNDGMRFKKSHSLSTIYNSIDFVRLPLMNFQSNQSVIFFLMHFIIFWQYVIITISNIPYHCNVIALCDTPSQEPLLKCCSLST